MVLIYGDVLPRYWSGGPAQDGANVGAKNVWEYMQKAQTFLSGLTSKAKKIVRSDGTTKYIENGQFIIVDSKTGKIVSYGAQ